VTHLAGNNAVGPPERHVDDRDEWQRLPISLLRLRDFGPELAAVPRPPV
jgi:hypothetical protein